jgi:hypothetical protein
MNIIKKINEYNEEINKEIGKKINLEKKYHIGFDKTDKNNLILKENNKTVLISNYIFYGIYQLDTKLWIWGNSLPGINKKQIKIINEIKNKNYLFENNDNKDILFIYQLLTNDVLLIDGTNVSYNLKLINKVLSYLSNSILILNPINKTNNMHFLGITKIIELYV